MYPNQNFAQNSINSTKPKNNKKHILPILLIFALVSSLAFILVAEIDRRNFNVPKEDVKSKIGTSSSSSSSGEFQSNAQDSEIKTDIAILHSQIEAYHASYGHYPNLPELNSTSFREEYLKRLDSEDLKTPRGTESVLTSSPNPAYYGYTTSLCNKSGSECLSYELSAILNNGQKYTKTALN